MATIPTIDDVAKLPTEERLDRLTRTPDELAARLEGKSASGLARRPDAASWAPVEVVCHLRDADRVFMERFQTIAAIDEPRLAGPDTDRWVEEQQYLRHDATVALGHFRRRRDESLAYLRGLPPAGWRRGGVHPVRGRITVDDFVTLMAFHDLNHLAQLDRGLRGEP